MSVMLGELRDQLGRLRRRRRFDAEACAREKAEILKGYLGDNGVRACIVGVSGGIDSAVALALTVRAAHLPHSPIDRVVAALLPYSDTAGATNQERTTRRGRAVAEALGVEPVVIDLARGFAQLRSDIETGFGGRGSAWAAGQLVSYLRTPVLYYLATLLTDQGTPAVVLGTTNRDEGAYLGFFGKASDGMVDIQLVSDLHKSEIRSLAEYLGLPPEVLNATPTGDTFDGRTDLEMIGAPYDFVELHALLKTLCEPSERLAWREGLSVAALKQLDEWTNRLEDRHRRNRHKYIGDSPAVHLDLYPRAIPGGWRAQDIRPSRLSNGFVPDLWERFGLRADATSEEVDHVFAQQDVNDEEVRRTWKLLRDPLFSRAYTALGNVDTMEEGGFFDDGGPAIPPIRDDPRWLATPVHAIRARLHGAPKGRSLKVVLTTGGLWPMHEGHVRMMEIARAELERRGDIVLGGYLSPGHDEYLELKCGRGVPTAAERVRMCEFALADHDWLMVDSWEALRTERAVNFSDVIDHVERYLAVHVPCHRRIGVVYVYGGDNARFGLAFAGCGEAICVPRPGYEEVLETYAGDSRIRDNPRVTMLRDTLTPNIASFQLRETGQLPRLPASAQSLYIRDEGSWSIEPWLACDGVDEAWTRFIQDLISNMEASFGKNALEVLRLDLATQRASIAEATAGEQVLSLDPCLPGDQNLALSRGFEIAADRLRSLLVPRPGAAPLDEQIAAIPPGEYILLDDDSVTGHTLRGITALLPAAVQICRTIFASDLRGQPQTNLVDARDFLVGSREGGLVVVLPDGSLARAPYALPYVRVTSRIGAPASVEQELSRAIWTLNVEFFSHTSLCVADVAPGLAVLCRYLGFEDDCRLERFCRWHLKQLF